jgi:serine/threonine protein kinase
MDRCLHIVDFREILEDDLAYYIVMEPCSGGELFKFLLTESRVPETECKRIMREILTAVDHLHQTGLIHRDIKPENIMFEEDPKSPMLSRRNQVPANTLKLIDFDTCDVFDPEKAKRSRRIIGTLGYIAPESYMGEYTPVSDLWSVGVIFYILMTGDMPYDDSIFTGASGDNNVVGSEITERIHKKLYESNVDWTCVPWPAFPLAKDLCQQLLELNPSKRVQTAQAAMAHPWLDESSSTVTGAGGSSLRSDSSSEDVR